MQSSIKEYIATIKQFLDNSRKKPLDGKGTIILNHIYDDLKKRSETCSNYSQEEKQQIAWMLKYALSARKELEKSKDQKKILLAPKGIERKLAANSNNHLSSIENAVIDDPVTKMMYEVEKFRSRSKEEYAYAIHI